MSNYTLNCHCKLAEIMRNVVPVAGVEFEKLVLVDMKPGDRIGTHAHQGHTVLYYPSDAAPIVVTPTEGMIIYLPPGTKHEVPKVSYQRVSVAMLVE